MGHSRARIAIIVGPALGALSPEACPSRTRSLQPQIHSATPIGGLQEMLRAKIIANFARYKSDHVTPRSGVLKDIEPSERVGVCHCSWTHCSCQYDETGNQVPWDLAQVCQFFRWTDASGGFWAIRGTLSTTVSARPAYCKNMVHGAE